jgi:DNA-binding MarR family transcriptional regulator
MKPMPNQISKIAPEARPSDPLVLEDFLPYRLSILSNRVSNAIARVYQRKFGLSIPEWRLVAVVGRFGPMSANEAAERTEMDKVRVSRAVQRMLAAGLLERATDAQDRRRSILQLSPKGVAIRVEIAPYAHAIEQQLLAPLSDADRTDLERVMRLLEKSAQTFQDGGRKAKRPVGA